MDDEAEAVPPVDPPWWRTPPARVLAGIIIAIVVIVVKNAVFTSVGEHEAVKDVKADVAGYHVGDCVVIRAAENPARGLEARHNDCATEASFTIGAAYDSNKPCENENYDTFEWTVSDNAVSRLCLAANLVVDHCYRAHPDTMLESVACTNDDEGTFQVVALTDSEQPEVCPADTVAFSVPVPARTYCLGSPAPASTQA